MNTTHFGRSRHVCIIYHLYIYIYYIYISIIIIIIIIVIFTINQSASSAERQLAGKTTLCVVGVRFIDQDLDDEELGGEMRWTQPLLMQRATWHADGPNGSLHLSGLGQPLV